MVRSRPGLEFHSTPLRSQTSGLPMAGPAIVAPGARGQAGHANSIMLLILGPYSRRPPWVPHVLALSSATCENARALIGGIHGGYERNTTQPVSQPPAFLKTRPEVIPLTVTLHIIPLLDPAGAARGDSVEGQFKCFARWWMNPVRFRPGRVRTISAKRFQSTFLSTSRGSFESAQASAWPVRAAFRRI